MVKRIVSVGCDRAGNHRPNWHICPFCDHRLVPEAWVRAATTLVLTPAVYKADVVTVLSECPECFEVSWVHVKMGSFDKGEWPASWKEAVAGKADVARVEASLDWEAGICRSCRHLDPRESEFRAWKRCKEGAGPPVGECGSYEQIEGGEL